MDTVTIEEQSYQPIKPFIEKINSIKNKSEVIDQVAYFHSTIANPFFFFFADADAKNSEMVVAQLYQAGLGLPEREYYFAADDRSQNLRSKYSEHVSKMFMLAGYSESEAKNNAQTILDLETKLAKVSMTKLDLRDPNKTYNKMTLDELQKLSPNFDWKNFFTGIGLENPGDIIVGQPEFFKGISNFINEEKLEDLKTYLTWNLIRSSAKYLSSDFVNENFDFYGKTLTGSQTIQPRWKRILQSTNGVLGEALGELYVKENFPPAAKEKANELVKNLIKAMEVRIKDLEWMTDETKKQALEKLSAFTVKIGYPDKWKDYSTLEITPDSYFTNMVNYGKFEMKKTIAKVGKPVDKTEWYMPPQTVNAYYNPTSNEIVFPAGILQPPFFNANADDAVNYGGIGAVIGHEITHGFDDMGRQFDAKGNIRDWWTAEDNEKFNARAKAIIDQYEEFKPIDTLSINGSLTQGENIADLGGLSVALTAYKMTDEYKKGKEIDGFTSVQRFFLGWAQVWKNNIRDENLVLRINTDPHSPGKYRVLGPLVNMPEFYEAFGVKDGDPMKRPENKRVKIW